MTTEKCDQGEGTAWGFCRPFMCSVIHHPSITKLDPMAHSSFLSSSQDPRPSSFDAQLYLLQRGRAALCHSGTAEELRAQGLKTRLSRPPPESASSMSPTSGFLVVKVPRPEPRPSTLLLARAPPPHPSPFPHPPDHGFTKSFLLQASPLSAPTFQE